MKATLSSKVQTQHGGRSLVVQLLVEVVLSVALTTALQLGNVAAQLLDGFHLLPKELSLNVVRHLREEKDPITKQSNWACWLADPLPCD